MIDQDARCKGCNYPLKGLPSGECPECGAPFDWNKRTTYRLEHDKSALVGMLLNRRWPTLRFVLAYTPGVLLSAGYWSGAIDIGYWGCFILLAYPFWLVLCVALLLSAISPIDTLSTSVSILLGIVLGMVLGLIAGPIGIGLVFGTVAGFIAGLVGIVFGAAAGLVAALVYQHMELNNML